MKEEINIVTVGELRDILAKEYGYDRTFQTINYRLPNMPGGDPRRELFAGKKVIFKSEIPAVAKFLLNRWAKQRKNTTK